MVVPVDIGKDGSFNKSSHVLSTSEFEVLMRHVHRKLVEFGEKIYQGEIGAKPYELGESYPCKYCPYNGICGLEKKTYNACKNLLDKIEEDDIWRELNANNQVDPRSDKGN